MESCQLFEAWRQSLTIAVNRWRYKDGAFIDVIEISTPVVNAIDIFIASPLLSDKERVAFRELRRLLFIACGNPRIIPTPEFLAELGIATEMVTEVFNEDRKRQGQYVPPPMMAQPFVGNDGEIQKTFELNSNGIVKINKEAVNQHFVPRADGNHGGFIKIDPSQMVQTQRQDTTANLNPVLIEGPGNFNDGKKSTRDHGGAYQIHIKSKCAR